MGTLVTLADRRQLAPPEDASPAMSLPAIDILLAKLDGREAELASSLSALDRGITDLLRQREAICRTLFDLRQSLVALSSAASGQRNATMQSPSR